MTKPRIRICTDGRIGWPDVVQYEILEGPKKGRLLTCPPTVATDPDPKSRLAPTPADMRDGRVAGWEGRQDRSYPYRIVVHDRVAYDRLRLRGDLASRRHTGGGQVVDNRAAPGA